MGKKVPAAERARLDKLGELAQDKYAKDDVLDIDLPLKPSEISEGNDGIWVRAWVFVDNEALRKKGVRNPYDDQFVAPARRPRPERAFNMDASA
jgi:hypothetical protein